MGGNRSRSCIRPDALLEKTRQPLASLIQGLVIHTDWLVMRTPAQWIPAATRMNMPQPLVFDRSAIVFSR
jgi:hypothetical protein